ncbi:hypothetical protein BDF19DRAFT_448533 [Syncephalis fuscata]|nr:hypothetical protein BDF19DRAFT_448533 [Syncephalis fuscata]
MTSLSSIATAAIDTDSCSYTMLKHAQQLYDQSLIASAQLMAGMALSELQRLTAMNSSTYVEASLLFAQCLVYQNDYRRAMTFFEKAFNTQLNIQRNQLPIDDLDIKICTEYAECCLKVNEWDEARRQLEVIHKDRRPLDIWRILARIYQVKGNPDAAIKCYINILKQQPFAMEAAIALVELGIPLDKLNSLLMPKDTTALNSSSSTAKKEQSIVNWMSTYLKAESAFNTNNYTGALKMYRTLERKYPKNTNLMLKVANCQVNQGDTLNAYHSYMAIRSSDPKMVEGMDRFAGLIRGQGNMLLLNRLAENLMTINELRPEPWVAMAIYCQSRNQLERGLMLTDRALALNQHHIEAQYVKGTILRLMERNHDALRVFRTVYQYSRNPYIYQGLLDIHLQQSNLSTANLLADEALARMPNNIVVLSLVANVYIHTKENMDEPRELISRALKRDSSSMSALRALQKLLVKEGRYDDAIIELKKQLPLHNTDAMHCNLGELYILIGDYRNALDHYNSAVR